LGRKHGRAPPASTPCIPSGRLARRVAARPSDVLRRDHSGREKLRAAGCRSVQHASSRARARPTAHFTITSPASGSDREADPLPALATSMLRGQQFSCGASARWSTSRHPAGAATGHAVSRREGPVWPRKAGLDRNRKAEDMKKPWCLPWRPESQLAASSISAKRDCHHPRVLHSTACGPRCARRPRKAVPGKNGSRASARPTLPLIPV